ncbi:MAG: DMT family transporter [Alicyclobacillus sp.]|nr:DMT family transporter [Alicyclobacillus sp.]
MRTRNGPTAVMVYLMVYLVLVWGVSWPIYKAALAHTPPMLFAGIRTLAGGIVLTAAALYARRPLAWRQVWHIYLISSLFNAVLFYGLQTAGLTLLPEGLLSVLVYLEPVLVGIFAWLWLDEPLTRNKVAGLVCGFAGVAVISLGDLHGRVSAVGTGIGLATGLAWALGTVFTKRVEGRVDLWWLVAVQFLIGGGVLTAVGAATESWSQVHWVAPAFLLGMVFGTFCGVSTSWLAWFKLLHMGEASRVAAFTFLVPLIAVGVGSLVLGEQLTWRLLAGLVLIAASIFLVNRRVRPGATP